MTRRLHTTRTETPDDTEYSNTMSIAFVIAELAPAIRHVGTQVARKLITKAGKTIVEYVLD